MLLISYFNLQIFLNCQQTYVQLDLKDIPHRPCNHFYSRIQVQPKPISDQIFKYL